MCSYYHVKCTHLVENEWYRIVVGSKRNEIIYRNETTKNQFEINFNDKWKVRRHGKSKNYKWPSGKIYFIVSPFVCYCVVLTCLIKSKRNQRAVKNIVKLNEQSVARTFPTTFAEKSSRTMALKIPMIPFRRLWFYGESSAIRSRRK